MKQGHKIGQDALMMSYLLTILTTLLLLFEIVIAQDCETIQRRSKRGADPMDRYGYQGLRDRYNNIGKPSGS